MAIDFGDHGAVVENQRRHALHRIDRGEGVALLLQRAEIDLLGRNRDSLLGEEDTHPPRIGSTAAIIELHLNFLP